MATLNRTRSAPAEVAACPFCSSDSAVLVERTSPVGGFRVQCMALIGCHATSGEWGRVSDAIATWNRRAPSVDVEALAEEILDALEAGEAGDADDALDIVTTTLRKHLSAPPPSDERREAPPTCAACDG